MPDIFQLTVVSQNDPGCSAGANLSVVVNQPVGGTLRSDSSPVGTPVHLPTPPGQGGSGPTPNWWLELSGDIDQAAFTLTISGPGQTTTMIAVPGAMMREWIAASQPRSTNQVWLEAGCGIFGYAQENTPPGQPKSWIYTVTAGVHDPRVHPPR
jgi:hypothetical protein